MTAWRSEQALPTALAIAAGADLSGKLAIVTGATSGIGYETARALSTAGAHVVLAVRNLAAGQKSAAALCEQTRNPVTAMALDLADVNSVRSFAGAFWQQFDRLDFLVANAGVSKTPEAHLPNGLDVRFATNHLGHFLLSHELLDSLGAKSRIVMLSSAAHKGRPLQFDDLQWQRRPRNDLQAYGESKTANILFAMTANERWADRGITVNAVLPGSALTGLQRYHGEALKRQIGFIRADGSIDPQVRSAAQAAATSVWACVAPTLEDRGGLVLEDCDFAQPVGPDTHPWRGFDPSICGDDAGARLWQASLDILSGAQSE